MKNLPSPEKLCHLALSVIEIETEALRQLTHRINEHFVQACQLLLQCQGRIVVIGMGKSGHIGGKIAATLASTGSPAFFVHPGEASHGDMGMITKQDVVLAVSYSGETDEIITLLPLIKRLDISLISLTGNPSSTIAVAANVNLNVAVAREACPLDLAPTASTTATLVMGDAIAVALLEARGFTAEDFARSHPGGRLGRRLLLLIDDLMHTGTTLPQVAATTRISDALMEITEKRLGMTTVINHERRLVGIFTDGDLRRAINKNIDIHQTCIADVMTKTPHVVERGLLAAEALQRMEKHKITALIVIDEQQRPLGVVHLHDLLNAGVA